MIRWIMLTEHGDTQAVYWRQEPCCVGRPIDGPELGEESGLTWTSSDNAASVDRCIRQYK